MFIKIVLNKTGIILRNSIISDKLICVDFLNRTTAGEWNAYEKSAIASSPMREYSAANKLMEMTRELLQCETAVLANNEGFRVVLQMPKVEKRVTFAEERKERVYSIDESPAKVKSRPETTSTVDETHVGSYRMQPRSFERINPSKQLEIGTIVTAFNRAIDKLLPDKKPFRKSTSNMKTLAAVSFYRALEKTKAEEQTIERLYSNLYEEMGLSEMRDPEEVGETLSDEEGEGEVLMNAVNTIFERAAFNKVLNVYLAPPMPVRVAALPVRYPAG